MLLLGSPVAGNKQDWHKVKIFCLLGPADSDEEAPSMQPLARRKKAKRSKLGLLPLVALIFYEVSGGPFGTEVRQRLQTRQRTGSHLLCYRLVQGLVAVVLYAAHMGWLLAPITPKWQ